jgi:hypothetical protein
VNGLGYTVLGSTNLTNWTVLGPATSPGGNAFEFTATTATNSSLRFYQFRSP